MSSENDNKPAWKVIEIVTHCAYTELELANGRRLRVNGANLSDEEISTAIEQFHQKTGGAYREQPTNDPLGIRTTNAPATTSGKSVKSLRWRDLGNSFWLLWWLRCTGVPEDWNEREPILICDGDDIPDAELAARLDVSVRTLASWRHRLKKLRLIFAIPGPDKSHSYALAPMQHLWFGVLNGEVPPDEQQRIVGRAPASIQ